jgi:hypothetical protein
MPIVVDAHFDSGALKNAVIDGTHIVLTPAPYMFNDRLTGNWLYARMTGAAGKRLTVSFDTTDCDLHGYQADNKLWLSTDNMHWQVIADVRGSGNDYQCQFDTSADCIWIAQTLPYQMHRVASRVAEWLVHPCARPTRSANHSGQICDTEDEPWLTALGYSGVSGQEIPALPLYAFEVGAPALPRDAPVVVVFGGNHAGEHIANYVVEFMVDWWLGETSEAQTLRECCRLQVYPMVNPAGRYGGFVRGGPEFPFGDHNRIWSPEDRGQLPHVDRLKRALAHDTQGPVEFFFDAHNTERSSDSFMYVNTTMHLQADERTVLPLLARMQRDVPGFRLQMTDSFLIAPQNTTCKSWGAQAADGPQATYSYTLEPGSPAVDPLGVCRNYGESLGRGVYDHFSACAS